MLKHIRSAEKITSPYSVENHGRSKAKNKEIHGIFETLLGFQKSSTRKPGDSFKDYEDPNFTIQCSGPTDNLSQSL